MKFNIAAFTDIGTEREKNQDRILVQDKVFADGIHFVEDAQICFCFVADGIGGGPAGENAAQFVLDQITSQIKKENDYTENELSDNLKSINLELINSCNSTPDFTGSGTTLVGLIIHEDNFKVINAGDSEAYLLRNDSLIKITEDQVFDPFEENSPLISYFGGNSDVLNIDFDTVLREIKADDKLLLASDGLMKALDNKQVKAILSNSKPIEDKAKFILRKALEAGSADNVSCILIEVIDAQEE